MNLLEIKKELTSMLVTIAGIAGFKSLDNSNKSLDVSNIIFTANKNNKETVDISMGLILMNNVSAKLIVEEIHQLVTYILKKREINLGILTIYVKGTINENN